MCELSEEEKKAIEKLKRIIERYEHKPIGKISVEFDEFDYNLFKTLLNLIEKQQKGIAQKDNIIDLMAEQLTTPVHNKRWVIDYFEEKSK